MNERLNLCSEVYPFSVYILNFLLIYGVSQKYEYTILNTINGKV